MKTQMKSKVTRRLISLGLALTLLMLSASPTFAASLDEKEHPQNAVANAGTIIAEAGTRAGAETWSSSGLAGNYTFEDYNLTPVKTIGKSGTLVINGSFYGDDGYAISSPIRLTVQIRSTSGSVKAATAPIDNRTGSTPFSLSCAVTAGEQIQLYFDASSLANPPGILRKAHVTYYYSII